MRGKNGRFTKNEVEDDAEFENIKAYEYSDLWIYKVIDAFARAMIGMLLRLGIQVFFLLLFAILLKKIGFLEIFKEIFATIMDVFNFIKPDNTSKNENSDAKTNGSAKSYFS